MADINRLVEELGQLTVLQACELAKTMEEKWGIDLNNIQAAPAQAPALVEKARKCVPLVLSD